MVFETHRQTWSQIQRLLQTLLFLRENVKHRRAAEAAFEREKAERLDRTRKKRRAEEAAKLREVEAARRQKVAVVLSGAVL